MNGMVIRREIEIEAPAERVWPFVATEEGLRTWWRSVRSVVLEPREGGRFEIRGDFDGNPYLIAGRVVVFAPPSKFAITWREQMDDGNFWPADTAVTFTLTERSGRTHVVVEHSGFEQLPAESRERVFQSYQRGWTDEEMVRLRDLVREEVRR